MHTKLVIANWKMNCLRHEATTLIAQVSDYVEKIAPQNSQVVVCPPSTLFDTVKNIIRHPAIFMGAQDCHVQKSGAFTGDLSAVMLKDAGCDFVIIGHSERRQNHNESSDLVAKKAAAVIAENLHPIICVGETEAERRDGSFYEVLPRQVLESLPPLTNGANLTIAYEPVWAIGSGLTPTMNDIEEAHLMIRKALSGVIPNGNEVGIKIVYGGSVKASNALEILSSWQVDGVLVGGASLKAEEFASIISAAEQAVEGVD